MFKTFLVFRATATTLNTKKELEFVEEGVLYITAGYLSPRWASKRLAKNQSIVSAQFSKTCLCSVVTLLELWQRTKGCCTLAKTALRRLRIVSS